MYSDDFNNKNLFSKTLNKLFGLLFEEKQNLAIFLIYSIIISILYLIIPLTAQILVNTIATGVLLQPLFLMSIMTLIALSVLGVLKILQIYIGEMIQRKIFIKMAMKLSAQIPQIEQKHFSSMYAPELINRFFDTLTIQKNLNLLLLEVPSAILQILLGLILMALYNPFLMIFDFVLIASVMIIGILGKGALSTSIQESSSKYKVAYWLEEIARCQISFKMNAEIKYLLSITDKKLWEYFNNRKKHFQILLKQLFVNYFFQAVGITGILAIGGLLVINGHLNLGQLVAAELIIVMILSALEKIIQKLDAYYDLLTAIEKTSYISELSIERSNGSRQEKLSQGVQIRCEDLSFFYNPRKKILNQISFNIESGARISLVGVSGSGKTSLAYVLSGLLEAQEGTLLFNDVPINSLNMNDLRRNIALVSDDHELFAASIEENIRLGRSHISQEELNRALDLVELRRDLQQFPEGLQTILLSEGRNLSLGQRQRILLARAILDSPQLLILDEAFAGMDEMTKLKIINKVFDKKQSWTILNISHDAEVVSRTDYIYLLDKAEIKEQGCIEDLIKNQNSAFNTLFPELCKNFMISKKDNI